MRTYQIEQQELAEQVTAVLRATVRVGDIAAFVGRAFGTVAQVLATQGRSPAGPPFARYHRVAQAEFDVEAGFPAGEAVTPVGEVSISSLPAGPVAVLIYVGPYDEMEPAYDALAQWIVDRGGHPTGDPWEVYLSDPAQEPDPGKWRTEIVMPFGT